MAAQSNPPTSFGYTWGFADNSRTDGNVVEISPNINYTVSEAVSFLFLFYDFFYFLPKKYFFLKMFLGVGLLRFKKKMSAEVSKFSVPCRYSGRNQYTFRRVLLSIETFQLYNYSKN